MDFTLTPLTILVSRSGVKVIDRVEMMKTLPEGLSLRDVLIRFHLAQSGSAEKLVNTGKRTAFIVDRGSLEIRETELNVIMAHFKYYENVLFLADWVVEVFKLLNEGVYQLKLFERKVVDIGTITNSKFSLLVIQSGTRQEYWVLAADKDGNVIVK